MLIRPDLYTALTTDVDRVIMDHYTRSVLLRFKFRGVVLPWTKPGEVLMPGCHVVAHAYAKAFGCKAVDGEHAFFQERNITTWRRRTRMEISTYMHSWNIIYDNNGLFMILDIFPDEGCPVMPILLRHPHPAYWLPDDKKFRDNVTRRLALDEHFPIEVDLVAEEFCKIDA